jgi:hypothetical protein
MQVSSEFYGCFLFRYTQCTMSGEKYKLWRNNDTSQQLIKSRVSPPLGRPACSTFVRGKLGGRISLRPLPGRQEVATTLPLRLSRHQILELFILFTSQDFNMDRYD